MKVYTCLSCKHCVFQWAETHGADIAMSLSCSAGLWAGKTHVAPCEVEDLLFTANHCEVYDGPNGPTMHE